MVYLHEIALSQCLSRCKRVCVRWHREAKGAYYEPGSLHDLLGNVSVVKMEQAKQQTDELLATLLADTVPT